MWANKNNNNGFTVVETLIVLAVSTMLFLSVSIIIQGQLTKNRSRDAAYRLQATVQSVISDVGNGFYPLDGNTYNCSGAQTGTGDNRGTNTGCVLAGKRIIFDTNKLTIETLTVPSTTTVLGSVPTIFTPIDNLKVDKEYPWQGKQIGGPKVFYVLNSVFTPTMSGSAFVSGAQKVILFAATSAGTPFAIPSVGNNIVCIDNGKYHASLTFPTNGTISVNLQINDRTNCP